MIRKPFGKSTDAGALKGSDHDIRPMRRKSLSGGQHPSTPNNNLSPKPSSAARTALASRFSSKKVQSPKLWESKGNLVFGPKESPQREVDEARKSAALKFSSRSGPRARRASLTHVSTNNQQSSPPRHQQWMPRRGVQKQSSGHREVVRKAAAKKFRRASLNHVSSPAAADNHIGELARKPTSENIGELPIKPVSLYSEPLEATKEPPAPRQRRASLSHVASSITNTGADKPQGQRAKTPKTTRTFFRPTKQLLDQAPKTCPTKQPETIKQKALVQKPQLPFAPNESATGPDVSVPGKKRTKVIVRRVLVRKKKGEEDVVVSRTVVSSKELKPNDRKAQHAIRRVRKAEGPVSTRGASSKADRAKQGTNTKDLSESTVSERMAEDQICSSPQSTDHSSPGTTSAKPNYTVASSMTPKYQMSKKIPIGPKTPALRMSPLHKSPDTTDDIIKNTRPLPLVHSDSSGSEEEDDQCDSNDEQHHSYHSQTESTGDDIVEDPSHTPLYEYALRCDWDMVAEECENYPRDAKCVSEADGTTALHLAVMSRSNPSLRSSGNSLEPAPLGLIEQLVIACPEAAIIRCTMKRYTPLIYACLVVDRQYNMKDASDTIAILLKHAPHSAYVFTEDGFSALDIHILSYSRFYKEREETFAGGHTSTLVLQTLLAERPDLAEARMYRNKVRGPVELLYRSNLEEFKNVGTGDGKLLEGAGSVTSPSDWWAWKWVALLLKYARSASSLNTASSAPFAALHAAASLVGCPLPVLSIAAHTYPQQMGSPDARSRFGNLPIHEVCSWISDSEIVCGDPFIQRRKTLAIQCLLDEYPASARKRNALEETPLQLAIESCTPWHDGIEVIAQTFPDALEIPRKIRECSDENDLLISRAVYDDNDSVDSDWVDPLEAVDGMFPFLVAAVVAHIPESKINPPSFVFSDRSTEKRREDIEKKELESLRTVYGLLRARPRVLSMYKPTDVGLGRRREDGSDSSSGDYTEVTCGDDDDDDDDVSVSDNDSYRFGGCRAGLTADSHSL